MPFNQRNKNNKNKKGLRTLVENAFIEPNIKEGDIVAKIVSINGGYPAVVTCVTKDGVEFKATIKGTMSRGPKKQILRPDDIVLCQSLDFDTNKDLSLDSRKMYVNHKYDKNDVKELKKRGYYDDTSTGVEFSNTPVQVWEDEKDDDEEEDIDIDDI